MTTGLRRGPHAMTVVFLTLHGRTRGHGLSQPRPPGKSQSGSQRPLQIIVFYNGRVLVEWTAPLV